MMALRGKVSCHGSLPWKVLCDSQGVGTIALDYPRDLCTFCLCCVSLVYYSWLLSQYQPVDFLCNISECGCLWDYILHWFVRSDYWLVCIGIFLLLICEHSLFVIILSIIQL